MTARRLTLVTTGLTCDRDTRIVTGVAIPYGQDGFTNRGKVRASKGSLKIAERVIANMEHDKTRPLATMVATDETDTGRTMSLRVVASTAGDDLLAEIEDGLRTGLSVEVDEPVIRDGQLVGGTIDGVAFCTHPAFDGARLTATAPDEGDPEDPEAEGVEDPEDPEAEPVEAEALEITPDTTIGEIIDSMTTPPDPAADPATASEEGTPVTAQSTGLAASAGGTKSKGIKTVREFVERMSAAKTLGDRSLLAALADVTQSGIGADVSAQQFLGELWSGKRYTRRIVPLMAHGDLTSYSVKGWRWTTKPVVADYSGNKADVPSATIDTEAVEVSASRLAGAHDIDRKFVDFGDQSFLTSYLEAMTESYAEISDARALTFLDTNATPVTAGAVGTNGSAAASALVDGALAVIDRGTPTFAIMGKGAYRALLLSGVDDMLAYLSINMGLDEGSLDGFKIVPSGGLDEDQVIVGIGGAATFYELAGSPIRVDALNIANGGVDYGLFGYYAQILNDADGLASVRLAAGSLDAGADFAMTVGVTADGAAGPTTYAVYPDGSKVDVTEDAVLTSATPAKASIVSNKVHAVAAGTSVITSTYQGKTDTVTVTVS